MLRETQLEMAERHVREGEAIIARQRALIDRLAQDGHPTGEARKFLRKFQKAQEEHVAHLEQLRGSASS
ncbi:hypothetical protein EN844_33975, partial [Mesorhizobium sp. M3A.F.Ca.ET.201.01.1.1]